MRDTILGTSSAWPSREAVQAFREQRWQSYLLPWDDHLYWGLSLEAAHDFLRSSGWPEDYHRGPEMLRRNPGMSPDPDPSELIGYDLTTFIEEFMGRRGYEEFSVVEVMQAARHPGVQPVTAFLSHVQSETVSVTLGLFEQVEECIARREDSGTSFLDYFCLRQCIDDFEEDKVRQLIGDIGLTFLGVSFNPSGDVELFNRTWCCYEVFCTVAEEGRVWAVNAEGSNARLPWQAIDDIDMRQMQASDENDRQRIIDYLDGLPGGMDAANTAVQGVFIAVRFAHRLVAMGYVLVRVLVAWSVVPFFLAATIDITDEAGWITWTGDEDYFLVNVIAILVLMVINISPFVVLATRAFESHLASQGVRPALTAAGRRPRAALPAWGMGTSFAASAIAGLVPVATVQVGQSAFYGFVDSHHPGMKSRSFLWLFAGAGMLAIIILLRVPAVSGQICSFALCPRPRCSWCLWMIALCLSTFFWLTCNLGAGPVLLVLLWRFCSDVESISLRRADRHLAAERVCDRRRRAGHGGADGGRRLPLGLWAFALAFAAANVSNNVAEWTEYQIPFAAANVSDAAVFQVLIASSLLIGVSLCAFLVLDCLERGCGGGALGPLEYRARTRVHEERAIGGGGAADAGQDAAVPGAAEDGGLDFASNASSFRIVDGTLTSSLLENVPSGHI